MKLSTPLLAVPCLLLSLVVLHPHHHHHGHGGLQLSAIAGAQLELSLADGWSKSVMVDGATRIHAGARALMLADLRPGQQVHERDRWNGVSYLAEEVEVLPERWADGQLVARDADHLLVRTRAGELESFALDASTHVHSRHWPAQLAFAQPGDHVIVSGDRVASDVDFPERSHRLFWATLLGTLALGFWAVRFGRTLWHRPGQ
jgi:hypothetical protein